MKKTDPNYISWKQWFKCLPSMIKVIWYSHTCHFIWVPLTRWVNRKVEVTDYNECILHLLAELNDIRVAKFQSALDELKERSK